MTENSIDPRSAMPRWAQISQILRKRIVDHGPELTGLSDQALTREFGVSPLTVRQAVQDLVNSGLVTRHRGKGTFVVRKPPQGSIDNLEASMSDWRIHGAAVVIRILERTTVAANIPTSSALGISPGETVGYFRRLRCTEGHPVGIDYRYILADLGSRLDDEDLRHDTVWEVLECKLRLGPLSANTTISAQAASDEEAALLMIPSGSPVLSRGFQLFDNNERTVLTGHSIYHPDRFIFARTMRRPGA